MALKFRQYHQNSSRNKSLFKDKENWGSRWGSGIISEELK